MSNCVPQNHFIKTGRPRRITSLNTHMKKRRIAQPKTVGIQQAKFRILQVCKAFPATIDDYSYTAVFLREKMVCVGRIGDKSPIQARPLVAEVETNSRHLGAAGKGRIQKKRGRVKLGKLNILRIQSPGNDQEEKKPDFLLHIT
jgi:hypothetical protein